MMFLFVILTTISALLGYYLALYILQRTNDLITWFYYIFQRLNFLSLYLCKPVDDSDTLKEISNEEGPCYISRRVDAKLEHFLEHLLTGSEFSAFWLHSPITQELRYLIRYVLIEIIRRSRFVIRSCKTITVRNVKPGDNSHNGRHSSADSRSLLEDLIAILLTHLDQCIVVSRDTPLTCVSGSHSSLHTYGIQYWRRVVERVLVLLIPADILPSRATFALLRECFCSCLISAIIDTLSDPDTINWLIVYLLDADSTWDLDPAEDASDQQQETEEQEPAEEQVIVLLHWLRVQQTRSVSPHMIEMRAVLCDAHLLYSFMHGLKHTHDWPLLQCLMSIYELHQNLQKTRGSEKRWHMFCNQLTKLREEYFLHNCCMPLDGCTKQQLLCKFDALLHTLCLAQHVSADCTAALHDMLSILSTQLETLYLCHFCTSVQYMGHVLGDRSCEDTAAGVAAGGALQGCGGYGVACATSALSCSAVVGAGVTAGRRGLALLDTLHRRVRQVFGESHQGQLLHGESWHQSRTVDEIGEEVLPHSSRRPVAHVPDMSVWSISVRDTRPPSRTPSLTTTTLQTGDDLQSVRVLIEIHRIQQHSEYRWRICRSLLDIQSLYDTLQTGGCSGATVSDAGSINYPMYLELPRLSSQSHIPEFCHHLSTYLRCLVLEPSFAHSPILFRFLTAEIFVQNYETGMTVSLRANRNHPTEQSTNQSPAARRDTVGHTASTRSIREYNLQEFVSALVRSVEIEPRTSYNDAADMSKNCVLHLDSPSLLTHDGRRQTSAPVTSSFQHRRDLSALYRHTQRVVSSSPTSGGLVDWLVVYVTVRLLHDVPRVCWVLGHSLLACARHALRAAVSQLVHSILFSRDADRTLCFLISRMEQTVCAAGDTGATTARTDTHKCERAEAARRVLYARAVPAVSRLLHADSALTSACDTLFSCFQHPELNRHLVCTSLDSIIVALFPELQELDPLKRSKVRV